VRAASHEQIAHAIAMLLDEPVGHRTRRLARRDDGQLPVGRKWISGNSVEEKLARVAGAQCSIQHRARVATQIGKS
jgi:hypothetical protein